MSVKPTIEESITMLSAKQSSSPTCIAILDDTKDCYAPDCPCARIPAHDPLLESCMTLEHKIVEVQNSFPGCGTSEFDGKTIVHEHRAIGRDWEDAYTKIPKTERATLLEAVREHEHNLAEEIKTLRTNMAEAIAQRDAARKQINPSYQMTDCCMCGINKHTPVRNDTLGGYVCGGCLDGAYEEIRAALATERAQHFTKL